MKKRSDLFQTNRTLNGCTFRICAKKNFLFNKSQQQQQKKLSFSIVSGYKIIN